MKQSEILLIRIEELERRLNIIEWDICSNVERANYTQKQNDKVINKIIKKVFWFKRKVEYVNYIPK